MAGMSFTWLLKTVLFFTAALTIIVLCSRRDNAPVIGEHRYHNLQVQSQLIDELTSPQLKPTPSTTRPTPTTTTAVVTPPLTDFAPVPQPQGRACFQSTHIRPSRVRLFDDVLIAGHAPPAANGSNIFFHETTCLNGTARLTVRQACAVESAARANRRTAVYVLFFSPAGHERDRLPADVFQALDRYPNVHLRRADLWTYARDTPAEAFMASGRLFESNYPSVHAADFVRLLSLYKWGGTHMDLDFVVRRSFEPLAPNYVAEELKGFLANGLMNFGADGIGHLMAAHLLTEFVRNFNGKVFAANGPALLKRVIRELCRTGDDWFACPLVRVLRKEQLYAVYGTKWERLFDGEHAAESARMFNESLAVHMWNALSRRRPVRVGEGSAYEMLAREFCPEVFATVRGGEF